MTDATMVIRVPVPWRRAPYVWPVSEVEREAAARMRERVVTETAANLPDGRGDRE